VRFSLSEDDFDTMFSGGSPLKKFFDIIIHANRNVSEHEMDKLFARFAVLEMMAEKQGVDEKAIKMYMFENQEEVENLKNSLLMTVTADIVTQTE
jgi:Domain of unknown function (DUF2018)